MARRDIPEDERDVQPLTLSMLVDCPECTATDDIFFTAPDGVFDAEDLVEPPTTTHTCEVCGHTFDVTYEGWSIHDEA